MVLLERGGKRPYLPSTNRRAVPLVTPSLIGRACVTATKERLWLATSSGRAQYRHQQSFSSGMDFLKGIPPQRGFPCSGSHHYLWLPSSYDSYLSGTETNGELVLQQNAAAPWRILIHMTAMTQDMLLAFKGRHHFMRRHVPFICPCPMPPVAPVFDKPLTGSHCSPSLNGQEHAHFRRGFRCHAHVLEDNGWTMATARLCANRGIFPSLPISMALNEVLPQSCPLQRRPTSSPGN